MNRLRPILIIYWWLSMSNYKQIRNERNKAENRIKKLKQVMKDTQNEDTKRNIKSNIKKLKNAVNSTRIYAKSTGKKIRSKEKVEANFENLKELNTRFDAYTYRGINKKNNATRIEINKASVKADSIYTKYQVQTFFNVTQKAWNRPGVDPTKRYEAILKAYGKVDLAQLFDDIVNNEKNLQLQKAREILATPDAGWTDEEKAAAFEILKDNEDDYIISPDTGIVVNAPDYAPMH
mgnify:CR=1 FL=1